MNAAGNLISTEAWVLHRAEAGCPGQLVREPFTFPGIGAEEVLAKPLYGCWEGNMGHAIQRSPIDVCALRNEDRVVLGNAGVVEVLQTGRDVATVREGDVCFIFPNGTPDVHGYPTTIFGYDAPGTVGVLAKTTKLHQRQLIAIPRTSPFTLEQWAAFSLRYVTAWANWQVAWGCWQTQMSEVPPADVFVCGWGGGVALAELALAKALGCRVAMLTSKTTRLSLLAELGIDAIDRSALGAATFEADLLSAIRERTGGQGVSIFIDNIGSHYRSTIKALGRQGVIATSGWKHGVTHPIMRSMECISRHIHVFTHYARYSEGLAAARFALERGWMAPSCTRVHAWDEIPRLAEDYVAGRVDDYFPIFAVNQPA